MSSKQFMLAAIVALFILGVGSYFLLRNASDNSQLTNLEGTVTEYNDRQTIVDGPVIFSINNTLVDIGGGLRADSSPTGEMYGPVHVGDKVKARLLKTEDGHLTIYDCRSCYIKKID